MQTLAQIRRSAEISLAASTLYEIADGAIRHRENPAIVVGSCRLEGGEWIARATAVHDEKIVARAADPESALAGFYRWKGWDAASTRAHLRAAGVVAL